MSDGFVITVGMRSYHVLPFLLLPVVYGLKCKCSNARKCFLARGDIKRNWYVTLFDWRVRISTNLSLFSRKFRFVRTILRNSQTNLTKQSNKSNETVGTQKLTTDPSFLARLQHDKLGWTRLLQYQYPPTKRFRPDLSVLVGAAYTGLRVRPC